MGSFSKNRGRAKIIPQNFIHINTCEMVKFVLEDLSVLSLPTLGRLSVSAIDCFTLSMSLFYDKIRYKIQISF